jgi:hypothetical protein
MGFEPMIRVLQDPTAAIQTLARLSPDSVEGSAILHCLGDRNP